MTLHIITQPASCHDGLSSFSLKRSAAPDNIIVATLHCQGYCLCFFSLPFGCWSYVGLNSFGSFVSGDVALLHIQLLRLLIGLSPWDECGMDQMWCILVVIDFGCKFGCIVEGVWVWYSEAFLEIGSTWMQYANRSRYFYWKASIHLASLVLLLLEDSRIHLYSQLSSASLPFSYTGQY